MITRRLFMLGASASIGAAALADKVTGARAALSIPPSVAILPKTIQFQNTAWDLRALNSLRCASSAGGQLLMARKGSLLCAALVPSGGQYFIDFAGSWALPRGETMDISFDGDGCLNIESWDIENGSAVVFRSELYRFPAKV